VLVRGHPPSHHPLIRLNVCPCDLPCTLCVCVNPQAKLCFEWWLRGMLSV
jgi:hypothetical protein